MGHLQETLFGFPVRSYGLFIAVAILGGLWLAKWVNMRRRPQYVPHMADFLLTAVCSCTRSAVSAWSSRKLHRQFRTTDPEYYRERTRIWGG
jgi:hypothetical protein